MPGLTILHGCRTLQLSGGMNTLIEEDDLESVGNFRWYAHKSSGRYYVRRLESIGQGDQRLVLFHRLLVGAPAGFGVDHINGDSLDNRRANLRLATSGQNKQNQRRTRGTSRFKGVSWNRLGNNWHARIGVNKQKIHLGFFPTEEEAAHAYDRAALKYFGEFACTNADIHGVY